MFIFTPYLLAKKILRLCTEFLIFFIFGLLLVSSPSFAEENENPYAELILNMDNLYMKNYESFTVEGKGEDEIEKKTLEDLSTHFSKDMDGVSISPEELKSLMNGDLKSRKSCFNALSNDSENSDATQCLSPVVKKYCTGESPDVFSGYIKCQERIQNLYINTLKKNIFQKKLEVYARSHQAFANGTLKDTGNQKFDIIVDLNILDVILFGDKFEAPQNSSPFFPHKSITELLQDEEEKNSNKATNTTNTNTTNTTNNTGTTNTSTTNAPLNDTNSTSQNTSHTTNPENSFSENTESGNSTLSNLDVFCIDPDILVFSPHIGINTTEDSENLENSENSEANASENSDNNESSSLSDEEMQNGNYFPDEDPLAGGEYPDLDAIKDDERARGYRKDCNEKERPLFGGRMCVPDFCTEVFCVRIYVKEGHKQTNLRALDCVECHIDKGNEALVPMISTLGQGTPHTNPMEPNFIGAFATFGGSFSGVEVYTQAKKLPFLVYDTGDSLTDQKKSKAEKSKVESGEITEKESAENSAQKKSDKEAEKLKKLVETNQELFELMIMDCSGKSGNIGDDISDEVSVCLKDLKERQQAYDKKYASQYNTSAIQNASKSNAYKNVVEPFLYGFTEDMIQINQELKKIDDEAIKKAAQQCQ